MDYCSSGTQPILLPQLRKLFSCPIQEALEMLLNLVLENVLALLSQPNYESLPRRYTCSPDPKTLL